MRAARSPDRTQTTAGAISHRRPRSHLLNTVVVRTRPQTERATDSAISAARSVASGVPERAPLRGQRGITERRVRGSLATLRLPSACNREPTPIARSGLAMLAAEPHRTTRQPAVERSAEPAICAAPSRDSRFRSSTAPAFPAVRVIVEPCRFFGYALRCLFRPGLKADVGIAAPPTRRPKPPPPSTLAMSVIDEPLLSRTAQRLAATTTALAHSAPPVRLLSDFRAFPNTLPNAPERKPLTTKGFRWRRGNLLLPRGDPLGTTLRHNRLAKNGPGCPGVRSSRSLCRN